MGGVVHNVITILLVWELSEEKRILERHKKTIVLKKSNSPIQGNNKDNEDKNT